MVMVAWGAHAVAEPEPGTPGRFWVALSEGGKMPPERVPLGAPLGAPDVALRPALGRGPYPASPVALVRGLPMRLGAYASRVADCDTDADADGGGRIPYRPPITEGTTDGA